MTLNLNSPTSRPRRVGRTVAITAAACGLLLGAAACSSTEETATREPPTAPSTAVSVPVTSPPPSVAPPTTPVPPTTSPAPPTTSGTHHAHRALLRRILESHYAATEFVGGRIALRDRDGSVTEVRAGTQGTDPASPPVEQDVPWNIGSDTKTFVAVVVLQLAEEGRIELDGGIDRYFPHLAGAERITIRQLLQHTSGLNDYKEQPVVINDAQREWSPSELIAVAEAAGRVGRPGGEFHYSNTNYIVLGEIIEQVTGNSWADEVRARVVQPLGLASTGVIEDDWSPGYSIVDGAFVDTTTAEHPSLGGAAGALQSTGRDLLRFVVALNDGTLLTPRSQAMMQRFVPGYDYSQFGITHGYGLGIERYSTDEIDVTGHLGTGVQSAFIGYDAEHGNAVAVMINTRNPESQGMMAIEALTAISEAD
jgi:D-alanyl-D-alanine carboxypeptidase